MRRRPPLFPLILLALWGGGMAWISLSQELERNLKGWLVMASSLLAGLFLLLWFFCSRRFSGRVRLAGLGLLILLALAARLSLRVDGVVDGRGLPRLAWRGSPSQAPRPAPLQKTAPVRPAAAGPHLQQAADVPQFFGPLRDGHAPPMDLEPDWAAHPPRELWRQPIGAGWSAFAVVGGLAYTQEQRGPQELVTCYDLATGGLVWSHAEDAHFTQWQGGDGPRATPSVQDGRVHACGATGILTCLDAATGALLWRKNILQELRTQNLEWGISASPLLVDDLVITTTGTTRGPSLAAWDRATGALRWQAGDDQASYASPLLATLAGRRVILCNAARALSLHDPATGTLLLEHPWGGEKWPKASQPVVIAPDHLFLSAGYGMGCQLLQIQTGPQGGLTARQVWTSLKMKTQFNSPAYRAGHLYGLDDGRLACLDAATGERLWKDGRFGSGQTLLCGAHLLVQNEDGRLHLCAAAPAGFQQLGTLPALSSKTWNHPVLAGRYLLLRNDREAVCYHLPVRSSEN